MDITSNGAAAREEVGFCVGLQQCSLAEASAKELLDLMSKAPAEPSAESRQVNDAETIQQLPPPPAGLAGSSSASGKNYNLTVSNKAGYLCHVHVLAQWPVPPEVPFAIFTHPDNSALFRDVKHVGMRKVLKTEPGYKQVQVEQLGEVQILWFHRTYSTWLHVTEDSRDPECLRTIFHLEKSDVLGKFSGEWQLAPIRDVAGHVVGCRGELHQDVLPKGMPTFMARVPVLGGALRGASLRAVTRVMDDINLAMDKIRAGHAAGRSTEATMRELCGPVAEAAHANGAVTSFAFDPADDDEDDDTDGQQGGAEQGTSASRTSDTKPAAGVIGQDQPAADKGEGVVCGGGDVGPTAPAPSAKETGQAGPCECKDATSDVKVVAEVVPATDTPATMISAPPGAPVQGVDMVHLVADSATSKTAAGVL